MTIRADYLSLDLAGLPSYSESLGAGFYLGLGNNKKPLLLVAPGTGNSVEPHVRYATDLVVTLVDGVAAKGSSQFLVTSDRIIVMVLRGSTSQVKLDGAAGSVYVFSATRDDLYPVEATKNWRGRLTGAAIRARDGQFALQVNSVIGTLEDDGQLTYHASLADLLDSLGP